MSGSLNYRPLGAALHAALGLNDPAVQGAVESFLVTDNEEIVLRFALADENGAALGQVIAAVRGVRDFTLGAERPDASDAKSIAELNIVADDPLLWELGPYSQIFGQAPLPDPYRFFLEYSRLVRDELKLRRDPVHYLNWRGGLSQWLEIVYSRVYSLMVAPSPLVESAIELLERQVATFEVLPAKRFGAAPALPERPSDEGPPFLLDCGSSWIIASEIRRVEG